MNHPDSWQPHLDLWFTTTPHIELDRTLFRRTDGVELRCLRGQPSRAFKNVGNFKWTSAVIGVSALLLQYRASALDAQKQDASIGISGGSGSPALSLDYAISKQSSWVLDMFGLDEDGDPTAKHLFKRINSGLRHSGDLHVCINQNALRASEIRVWIDGNLSSSSEELRALARQLSEMAHPKAIFTAKEQTLPLSREAISRPQSFVAPFDQIEERNWLADVISSEIREMLVSSRELSQSDAQRQVLRSLMGNHFFSRVSGSNICALASLDSLRFTRKGAIDSIRAAIGEEPITIAMPVCAVPTLAITIFLKERWGIPIEGCYRYVTGIEVLHRIMFDDFDTAPTACLLGVGQLAGLFSSGKHTFYQPVMPLPRISFRLMQSSRNSKRGDWSGRYVFVGDAPSSSALYFNDLSERGIIDPSRSTIDCMDPDEMAIVLRGDETARAVLWFPYYNINERYNLGHCIDDGTALCSRKENFLVVHPSLARQTRKLQALEVAIMMAAQALLSDPEEIKNISSSIANNPEFVKFVARTAGLHHSVVRPPTPRKQWAA